MAKFLENPFNPVIFISYNQRVKDFTKLQPTDPRVERTVHLDKVYCKYKSYYPNLICIGSPGSHKSFFLNKMINAQFEVIEKESAGLFHDSVDALFSSKDNPIGFNVFDFQGKFANEDYILIQDLLTHMPSNYLLVQVTELSYITNVLSKLNEKTRKSFSRRVLVITKSDDYGMVDDMKEELREIFFEDFDDEN